VSFGHLPNPFPVIFFWFQKVTLGSSLPRNVSRRRWQRSSMSFGNLPGLFLDIFSAFKKQP
jgi:hypothetical protein